MDELNHVIVTNLEIIKALIQPLSYAHHDFDVSRAALLILNYYFKMEDGWAIVPEFRVPEGKRPDFLVEKYGRDLSVEPQHQVQPKIGVMDVGYKECIDPRVLLLHLRDFESW